MSTKTKKGTAFGYEVQGKQYVKGTKFKKNKDGTISPVVPKKKK